MPLQLDPLLLAQMGATPFSLGIPLETYSPENDEDDDVLREASPTPEQAQQQLEVAANEPVDIYQGQDPSAYGFDPSVQTVIDPTPQMVPIPQSSGAAASGMPVATGIPAVSPDVAALWGQYGQAPARSTATATTAAPRSGLELNPLALIGLSILATPTGTGGALQGIARGIQAGLAMDNQLQAALVRREADLAKTRQSVVGSEQQQQWGETAAAIMADPRFTSLSAPEQQMVLTGAAQPFMSPAEAAKTGTNVGNLYRNFHMPTTQFDFNMAKQRDQQTFQARQQALRQQAAENLVLLNLAARKAQQTNLGETPEIAGIDLPADLSAEQQADAKQSWETIQQMPENSQGERREKAQAVVNWKTNFGIPLNTAEQGIQAGTISLTPRQRQQRVQKERAATDSALLMFEAGDILAQEIAPNRRFQSGFFGNLLALGEPGLKDLFDNYPTAPARFRRKMAEARENILDNFGSFSGILSDSDEKRLTRLTSSKGTFSVDQAIESLDLVKRALNNAHPGIVDRMGKIKSQFDAIRTRNPGLQNAKIEPAPNQPGKYQIRGPNGGIIHNVGPTGEREPYLLGD